MDFTFVHAADLHLDSPLVGLDRYEGAPTERIRGATRQAFSRLVEACCEARVDFLLLAGDLYDGAWKDYGTGLFFQDQMHRLREGGVRVVMIRGNHDAESIITARLRLPDNVRDLSTRTPETHELADLGVCIHGQGYSRRDVTDDLASRYPEPRPGLFNVGLLHTSADGREGHAPYAPCRVDSLRDKGYDYWALGHVHKREEILRGDPWVVFPGNLQGRHAKETGPKGATFVTVASGRIQSVESRAFDVVRWEALRVPLDGVTGEDEALGLVHAALAAAKDSAGDRLLASRVTLTGRTPLQTSFLGDPERWTNEIRGVANAFAPGSVWVEKVRFETRAERDLTALRRRDDPLGHLLRDLDALRAPESDVAPLLADLQPLWAKLPPELRSGPGAVALDSPDYVRRLLDDVEELLVSRLVAE